MRLLLSALAAGSAAAAGVAPAAAGGAGAPVVDPAPEGGPWQPWGIHTAYGYDPKTSFSVGFSTRLGTTASVVSLGTSPGALTQSFTGSSHKFTDVANNQWIHTVSVDGLQPGTTYYYSVGDGQGNSSSVYSFVTQPEVWDRPPVLAIFGDMGVDVNAQKTLPLLYKEAAARSIDVVLHIGDAAYDMDSSNGQNGDLFLRSMTPVAANVPYHFTVGK